MSVSESSPESEETKSNHAELITGLTRLTVAIEEYTAVNRALLEVLLDEPELEDHDSPGDLGHLGIT